MEAVQSESDFTTYLRNNSPYSSHFLADTLAFILVTGNKAFMNVLINHTTADEQHILVSLLKAEGSDYDDWLSGFYKTTDTSVCVTKADYHSSEVDLGSDIEVEHDDNVYDDNIESLVDAALNGKKDDYDHDEYNWGQSESEDENNDFIDDIERTLNLN